MTSLLAFLALFWLAEPSPVKGVPPPPGGTFETEITKVVSDRASIEMQGLLAELERMSQPAETKAEIKRRLAGLKVAVYTSPKSWDETVAFYEGPAMKVVFLKGERDILADLQDYARSAGIAVDPAVEKTWTGKSGRDGPVDEGRRDAADRRRRPPHRPARRQGDAEDGRPRDEAGLVATSAASRSGGGEKEREGPRPLPSACRLVAAGALRLEDLGRRGFVRGSLAPLPFLEVREDLPAAEGDEEARPPVEEE